MAESQEIDHRRELIERSEQLCMDLLRTDVGVAYTLLRLAKTEWGLGAVPHASELIEKAVTAHESILRHLDRAPVRLSSEKRALQQSAQELFQAIGEAKRELSAVRKAGIADAPLSDKA